jgi:outer membrane protein OmpA-like peptidoglycan-associated protein
MKILPSRVSHLVLIILLLTFPRVHGQEANHTKADKFFERARIHFEKGEWKECEAELTKAILADSTFADAYIMLGDIYLESGNAANAIEKYKTALRFNPEKEYLVQYLLANMLFSLENYGEACIYYKKALESGQVSAEFKSTLELKIGISEFRNRLMENPVSYEPVNLGPVVNTAAEEYINALASDGKGIYFTRRRKKVNAQTKNFDEDVYYAAMPADSQENVALLDYPPGKLNDAGAVSISADGRLLFFTACFRPENYGSCDLYFAEKEGDEWTVAMNMGSLINTEFWDAQPAISPDGKTLYFTSNRPGGKGSSDLWKTERGEDGSWGRPVNLGATINTSGSEMAPFIHFDNQTLYFSSSGHPGMGGTDLFKAVRTGSGWSEPENLGYPLNSHADELAIVVNPAGDKGFISNDNLKGQGGYDIYSFELTESIRPAAVSYLKGKVFDAVTRQPLEARFELIDNEQNSAIIDAVSDRKTGEFLVCLPLNRNYALNVSCQDYLFYSAHFPFSEIKSMIDPLVKDIPLEPVQPGKKIVLRNIFFNSDEYQLEPESFTELEKLFDFLSANPAIRIEIGGHTDDTGTEEYNAELSLKRARAVFEYLVNRGTEPGRLDYYGYGESRPITSNESEEGKALNRRTEITVLELK